MAENEPATIGTVYRDGDRVPVPDPTLLTTAALLREVGSLKELLQGEIDARVKILETRIAGIEAGIQKASEDYTRVPTLLDREMLQIRTLIDERMKQVNSEIAARLELNKEKFRGIETQFAERDTRTEQIGERSKEAISAALAAAKEAAEKSERQFVKLMDQLQDLLQATTHALDDKLTDIKERVTRLEAGGLGAQAQRQEQHLSTSTLISILALVLTITGIAVSAFLRTH